jgi:hypothetical protein
MIMFTILFIAIIYLQIQINKNNTQENFDATVDTTAIANLNDLASKILTNNKLTISSDTTINGALTATKVNTVYTALPDLSITSHIGGTLAGTGNGITISVILGKDYALTSMVLNAGVYIITYKTNVGMGSVGGGGKLYMLHGIGTTPFGYELDTNKFYGDISFGNGWTYPLHQNSFILTLSTSKTIYFTGSITNPSGGVTGVLQLTGTMFAVRIA